MRQPRGEAVISYGAALQVRDPATRQFTEVMGLVDFNGPQTSRDEIPITRLDSPAKEYALDLKDHGAFTASMQTLMGSKSQQILAANLDSPNVLDFRLSLPDDGFGGGEATCEFRARVSGMPITGAQGQVITTALSLRITGDVDWILPDASKPHLVWSAHQLNEDSANGGRVAGIISVILNVDTFSGDDGDHMAGVSFAGVPAGLTGEAIKVSDTTIYIGFSGTALAHEAGDSAVVSVDFRDAAFTIGPASAIGNSQGQVIFINFSD